MPAKQTIKNLARRVSIFLFSVLELLGLPRVPESKRGAGGEGA